MSSKLGMVSVPVGKNPLTCNIIRLKIKEWSVHFSKSTGTKCDGVTGKHVTIMTLKILKKISDPFLMPFIDSLYLQTAAFRNYKLRNYKLT